MTEQYLDLSKKILKEGEYEWNDRTKTGTLSLFGEVMHHDLTEGFPLLTTKRVAWRLPAEEYLFFLRGEQNVKSLMDKKVNIWNRNAFDFYLRRHNLEKTIPKHTEEWNDAYERYIYSLENNPAFAKKEGTLGRIYGVQARNWRKPNGKIVDQFANFIKKLKENPTSRSNIVSHFNPGEVEEMSLPPCHLLYQSRVLLDKGVFDLGMFQRSADYLLGVPFNQFQYSLLLKSAGEEVGLVPRNFSHLLGNVHFYIGAEPRSSFLRNEKNLKEFQGRMGEVSGPEDYLELKDWYLKNAPKEKEGTEGTDQIPFSLIQLSRKPREKPNLELKFIKEKGIWHAINQDAKELIKVTNYNPHKNLVYDFEGKKIKPLMSA